MSSALQKSGIVRAFAPGCPSDLELDRLHFGELASDHHLHLHVEACASCRERMIERRRSFLPESSARMKAAIHQGLAARRTEPWHRRWFAPRIAPFLVAVTTAFAVLFVMPRDRSEDVRAKGALGLIVYRERDGQVERTLSGETFNPGDRLRFEVELPRPGQLMIVGVEADGDRFGCYESASHGSIEERALEKQVLPGAIELDESAGQEELHAILCPDPFSREQVQIEGGRVVSPAGCTSTPFVLKKEPK